MTIHKESWYKEAFGKKELDTLRAEMSRGAGNDIVLQYYNLMSRLGISLDDEEYGVGAVLWAGTIPGQNTAKRLWSPTALNTLYDLLMKEVSKNPRDANLVHDFWKCFDGISRGYIVPFDKQESAPLPDVPLLVATQDPSPDRLKDHMKEAFIYAWGYQEIGETEDGNNLGWDNEIFAVEPNLEQILSLIVGNFRDLISTRSRSNNKLDYPTSGGVEITFRNTESYTATDGTVWPSANLTLVMNTMEDADVLLRWVWESGSTK